MGNHILYIIYTVAIFLREHGPPLLGQGQGGRGRDVPGPTRSEAELSRYRRGGDNGVLQMRLNLTLGVCGMGEDFSPSIFIFIFYFVDLA